MQSAKINKGTKHPVAAMPYLHDFVNNGITSAGCHHCPFREKFNNSDKKQAVNMSNIP
jgi:hypothetical protein